MFGFLQVKSFTQGLEPLKRESVFGSPERKSQTHTVKGSGSFRISTLKISINIIVKKKKKMRIIYYENEEKYLT